MNTDVTLQWLQRSPIEPPNQNVKTSGPGVEVTIEQGSLVGAVTLGLPAGAVPEHARAIGSAIVGPEFFPSDAVLDSQRGVIEIRYDPSAYGQAGSAAGLGRSHGLLTGASSQVLGFLLTFDVPRNQQALFQLDPVSRTWVTTSTPLADLRGRTVIVALHGIFSDVNTAFPPGCAARYFDGDPGNTLVLGYQYDWTLPIAENAEHLGTFLRAMHQTYPGSRVHLIAHSMGSLVAAGALLTHDVDPSMIAGFFPIAGMALGTPAARSRYDFFRSIAHTTAERIAVAAVSEPLSKYWELLPEGEGT